MKHAFVPFEQKALSSRAKQSSSEGFVVHGLVGVGKSPVAVEYSF
jgi:hypothetical protein